MQFDLWTCVPPSWPRGSGLLALAWCSSTIDVVAASLGRAWPLLSRLQNPCIFWQSTSQVLQPINANAGPIDVNQLSRLTSAKAPIAQSCSGKPSEHLRTWIPLPKQTFNMSNRNSCDGMSSFQLLIQLGALWNEWYKKLDPSILER